MLNLGFDNEKYLKIQSEQIYDRISKFGGKLYLEFGGKLFDDFHASRVLPGFEPDSKIRLLLNMRENAEIIIVINTQDIEKSKLRSDLGITYDADVLRLIDAFRAMDLYVGSVVLVQYTGQLAVDNFKNRLEKLGIKVYLHYPIAGYPSNISLIVSEDGYGRNEYIETVKPLVIVTAPGPGSGKMAVCLSQLYHEHLRGETAGYAKFETFPVWNLPLRHPINLAYEAATADLNDVNMIDPYHLEAYNKTCVNYNRDVEIFPVLDAIFNKIYGENTYCSPTDMGVNMAGSCIIDDEICREAANQEIVRRYYNAMCDVRTGKTTQETVYKTELLMNQANITPDIRKAALVANCKHEETGGPSAAIMLQDGKIVTGKTSSLLGATSACLLNALKELAGIPDETLLISPAVIEPIQKLKIDNLGNHNPRLHTDETLIALAVSATTNKNAASAMQMLRKLKGCEAHSTVILAQIDLDVFRKLGINLTCEPHYQTKKLYHR